MLTCYIYQLKIPFETMSKKGEDLLAELDALGGEEAPETGSKPSTDQEQSGTDVLEEFGIPERPKSSGRHTPKINAPSTNPASRGSPKRSGTPSNDGARSSEEKMRSMRKSGESTRSYHNSITPASTEETTSEPEKTPPSAEPAKQSSGGWWGAITSTASAAVKQAEALAKEIQQNEEAQRWAEQGKGNVTHLRGIGRSKVSRHRRSNVLRSIQGASFVPVLCQLSQTLYIH